MLVSVCNGYLSRFHLNATQPKPILSNSEPSENVCARFIKFKTGLKTELGSDQSVKPKYP